MKTSTEIIHSFYKTFASQFDNGMTMEITENGAVFQYDSIEVHLHKNLRKGLCNFAERDVLDALCRARLLMIERYNRQLPNAKRNQEYQDFDIVLTKKMDSFFITDDWNVLTIGYGDLQ